METLKIAKEIDYTFAMSFLYDYNVVRCLKYTIVSERNATLGGSDSQSHQTSFHVEVSINLSASTT